MEKSSPSRWRIALTVLKRSTVYVCLILVADTIGIALPSIVLLRNLFHYFTLVVLVQAGILFVIGGAADFTGSLAYRRIADHATKTEKGWSFGDYKQKQTRIAAYIVAGIVLLAVSLVLAYPLN